MTKSVAIIGSQWGDEGKGKITDFLTKDVDYVVRFQGGNNAGHTIWIDGKKTVLHVIPSGILNKDKISVIDHGVVFDPDNFLKEVAGLERAGVDINPRNLKISNECSVITSYHKILDGAREDASANKIGTTKKGIGPAYEDRVSRKGLKLKHLLNKENLKKKLEGLFFEKKILFDNVYHCEYPSIDEEVQSLFEMGNSIAPFLVDTFSLYDKDDKITLFEGAQGVLLDKDFGSYPFVTSSSTSYAGIFSGSSNTHNIIDDVIGITKAYTTRVGSGPFPTESECEDSVTLGRVGHEFGATTGRKRRCGWLDLPLLRYAIKVSRFTSLALTKVDVLCAIDKIKVCYAYEYEGQIIETAFAGIDLEKVKPLYKEFDSFKDTVVNGSLDQKLEEYISYIEQQLNINVSMVAFGPDRSQLHHRHALNIFQ
ncbi:MAG: adenylosuccinate synthase [Bacteriovoracaceae bacterium]|jgi:adenylosuccinate synthase|nr:adenylosuccinate synthase [Bacteriovoracaceae bacterium]